MQTLIFGAGNIGRGFLAKLMSDSGHSVVFVDVNDQTVQLINQEREYPVYVVSKEGMAESVVRAVRAITLSDDLGLTRAIVEADLILTAVGKNALPAVAKALATGLVTRSRLRPRQPTSLVVVACENLIDNTSYLTALIRVCIPNQALADSVLAAVSTPNCVIDRIVPNLKPDFHNPLAVVVEDYFQLAIDSSGLEHDFPAIPGVDIVSNLPALLEQKLFTLNMAHAITAYYGYLAGYQYIHEAVKDSNISRLLIGALAEVEAILVSRHGFGVVTQKTFATKVLSRFANPYLLDEVVRVARDPLRKLGPDDRLVKPARMAQSIGTLPVHLATGIASALHYDFADDQAAVQMTTKVKQSGIQSLLRGLMQIEPDTDLSHLIASNYLLRAL